MNHELIVERLHVFASLTGRSTNCLPKWSTPALPTPHALHHRGMTGLWLPKVGPPRRLDMLSPTHACTRVFSFLGVRVGIANRAAVDGVPMFYLLNLTKDLDVSAHARLPVIEQIESAASVNIPWWSLHAGSSQVLWKEPKGRDREEAD